MEDSPKKEVSSENDFFLCRLHLVSSSFVHGDSPIKIPLVGYCPGDFSKSHQHWGVSDWIVGSYRKQQQRHFVKKAKTNKNEQVFKSTKKPDHVKYSQLLLKIIIEQIKKKLPQASSPR